MQNYHCLQIYLETIQNLEAIQNLMAIQNLEHSITFSTNSLTNHQQSFFSTFFLGRTMHTG